MATFVHVVITANEPVSPGFIPPPGFVLDFSKAVALWKHPGDEYEVILAHDDLKAVEKSYFGGGYTAKNIKVKAKDINLAVL